MRFNNEQTWSARRQVICLKHKQNRRKETILAHKLAGETYSCFTVAHGSLLSRAFQQVSNGDLASVMSKTLNCGAL